MKYIRNFSIIAHVNHGKSTLSDRFIQICGGLCDREMMSQVLDSMELERERGITIKSQSVTLNYRSRSNEQFYQLNLIDTPGHVDFSYEVSRALAACEGAVLVVDAAQGIEAQTVANYRIAMERDLKVIIALNKIDLLTADINRVSKEIEEIIGINSNDIILCSAKTGLGVLDILERIIIDIPVPQGNCDAPLQALIIDSWFNNYLGVISLICVKNGILHKGDTIQSMNTGQIYIVNQLGIFTPKQVQRMSLNCGEVGWLVYTSKNHRVMGAPVGDTLTLLINPAQKSLPNFKKIQPYVYAGLFPAGSTSQKVFADALYKLSLNDSSLHYESEYSEYLGLGFRCGFLGLLHMEIIQERLKREYAIDLIITTPGVMYEVLVVDDQIIYVDNPLKLLSITGIKEIREPIVSCNFLMPKKYLGEIIVLCVEKRGVQVSLVYKADQVMLTYELPMSEIILDFFDRMKSISNGYASLEYTFNRFQASDMVCIEILINGQRVNALAVIVHRITAEFQGRILVNKLKSLILRQQFDIVIQAVIGKRVICRDVIKQLRKNVTHKCYGGDVTRKKKLLHNQKIGKRRMKQVGKVNLPNSVFMSILNRDS